MAKVSVLLPTKGRYEALEDSLLSLSRTTLSEELIELVVVADDDEKSYDIAMDFCLKKGHRFSSYSIIHSEDRLFPIKAFNLALENSSCEYFCSMNDENDYFDPNWLVRNLELFDSYFPDKIGVLSLFKEKKAGLCLTTKSFVEYNYGEFFNEGYQLYYADDELTCRAILLGRYAWSEQPGVFHDNEITKTVSAIPWDDKIAMKKIDRGVFYKRLETNFGLKDEEIYPWKGFRNVSLPLKRR